MKNLSEKEILERLRARRENFEITHEEVLAPDYEMWGRVREWQYHQGVCLLAGLSPVSKPYFELIINDRSPFDLVNWFVYYPTEVTDRNRLKNIHHLLEQVPQLSEARKRGRTVPPKALIDLCKGVLDLSQAPSNLLEVVNKFGPLNSLNLPNTFCSLEINPSELENLKKFKKQKEMPLAFNTVSEENPVPLTPRTPPIPSEAPLSIAKRLFPLKNAGRWEKADTLSLNEIVLLHYGINPERIYETHLPGEPVDDLFKEFHDYLNRHFYGDREWFVSQLDEDKLVDLLRRSTHAGVLKSSIQGIYMKTEIAKWMTSKHLAFPLRPDPEDSPVKGEIAKEDILNYELKRMDKGQLAKLMARNAAAVLWKEPTSRTLQQVQKHPHFKRALALAQELIGKKEPFDKKTVEDWIRNLNPNYKSKK